MKLDTRARRAADGVRASTQGVDPMAQITQLKHEDKTRRRTASTMAVLGATVVVVGTGWFAASQLGGDNSPPADPLSAPSPSASALSLEPGPTVGTRLQPPLVAKAPDSWTVFKDGDYVYLDADGSPTTLPHIDITGPLLQVFDVEQRMGVPIPPEGYANWLREHPWLSVLDDRMVVVDGEQFPQLSVMMARNAPGRQIALGRSTDQPLRREQWPDFSKGELVTQTVIEVDGKTMVVTSAASESDFAWDELDAAHELVLSTMKLPN